MPTFHDAKFFSEKSSLSYRHADLKRLEFLKTLTKTESPRVITSVHNGSSYASW